MEYLREEVETKDCIVGKNSEPGGMRWTQGQDERRQITKTIRDNEIMMLQKTRKIMAKMGGLLEERATKHRGKNNDRLRRAE